MVFCAEVLWHYTHATWTWNITVSNLHNSAEIVCPYILPSNQICLWQEMCIVVPILTGSFLQKNIYIWMIINKIASIWWKKGSDICPWTSLGKPFAVRTDNVCGQVFEYIFASSGGYCLSMYILLTMLLCLV